MKKGLIITLVIVLLLGCAGGGFAFYWFNRPIYKVTKALDNEDLDKAVDEFANLSKETEIEEVEGRFLQIAKDVESEFENENISYKELKKTFKKLNKVMGENDDYSDLVKRAETLNDSRESFDKAEELFEDENYEEAIEYYGKVIKDDSNYDKARKQIREAEKLMVPDIAGTWYVDVNIGKLLASEAGIDNVSAKMELNFVFDEDGTGYLKFDENSAKDFYDIMLEIYKQYIMEEFKNNGYDEEDIELLLSYSGYSSIDEMCEDYMPYDDFEEMIGEQKDYTYSVDDNILTLIYMDDGSDENFEFEMSGKDTLIIKNSDISGSDEMAEFGLEYPWELHRR